MFKNQTISVSHSSDTHTVRQTVRQAAMETGFGSTTCDEIVLAASELATNLVKHAVQGSLEVAPIQAGGRQGLQIVSLDRGPGIADAELAVSDGFSTRGSLGCGLGTVNRLMDELVIESPGGQPGVRITCRRYLPLLPAAVRPPLDIGAATRPHPGLKLNGDAFVIKTGTSGILTAIIDGLGHGQYAHRAAQRARQYIERHPDKPLVDLFRSVGRECRATRGVVMALARFNRAGEADQPDRGAPGSTPLQLTLGGVGNIDIRVHNSAETIRPIQRRGIVGRGAPNPIVHRHLWQPGSLMVLHTDGLNSHWKWAQFENILDRPATYIARRMVDALARDYDDATAVVVKWRDAADA